MVVTEKGFVSTGLLKDAIIKAQEFSQSRNRHLFLKADVTTCELLIGMSMIEECSAACFLHSKGITTRDIINWWDNINRG